MALTRPGLSGPGYGNIRLDVPGWYFVRRPDGTLAAEVDSQGHEMLALEPGPYEVARRDASELEVATITIDEGRATAVSSTAPRPVPFGRMVRKGGGPAAAYGLAIATDVRTPIADFGPAFGLAVAGRIDLPTASVELRLRIGRASRKRDPPGDDDLGRGRLGGRAART